MNTQLTSNDIRTSKEFFIRQIMQSFESLANMVNTGNRGVKCDSYRAGQFEFTIEDNEVPNINVRLLDNWTHGVKSFEVQVSFSTGFGGGSARQLLKFSKLVEEVSFAKRQAEKALAVHADKFIAWEEAAWANAID